MSLANAADDQKMMPFRKIMLQAGSSNYRPPHEKGKSAPKLKVIEEVIVEEDEELLLQQLPSERGIDCQQVLHILCMPTGQICGQM